MRTARIAAVTNYLPSGTLAHEAIGDEQPGVDRVDLRNPVDIRSMPVSASDEFTSHMAVSAARRLLDDPSVDTDGIDYLILVTQSPDFPLPTTACLVQDALSLPQNIGAVDVRLGCSGYVHALGLAKGLIASGQATKLLLLTSDVLTKLVHPKDKVTRHVFGDAATASLVVATEGSSAHLGSFVYGTDGFSAGSMVDKTLAKSGWVCDDVDLFVSFQAIETLNSHLRETVTIKPGSLWIDIEKLGDAGGSTIPLALYEAAAQGALRSGMNVLLAGFGVGNSWAGCTLTW